MPKKRTVASSAAPTPKTRRPGRPRGERVTGTAGGLAGELAIRLERARTLASLKTSELATRAGVGTGTILRIERGETSPTLETVVKLAAALDLTPAALLAGCPTWTDYPKATREAKRLKT